MTDFFVIAPWTDDQVATLNAYQHSHDFHSYTCGNDSRHSDGRLLATNAGWVCSDCGYTQRWAHAATFDIRSGRDD